MLGSPSAELAVTMSTEEKERVARQRERLGEDGIWVIIAVGPVHFSKQ